MPPLDGLRDDLAILAPTLRGRAPLLAPESSEARDLPLRELEAGASSSVRDRLPAPLPRLLEPADIVLNSLPDALKPLKSLADSCPLACFNSPESDDLGGRVSRLERGLLTPKSLSESMLLVRPTPLFGSLRLRLDALFSVCSEPPAGRLGFWTSTSLQPPSVVEEPTSDPRRAVLLLLDGFESPALPERIDTGFSTSSSPQLELLPSARCLRSSAAARLPVLFGSSESSL